MDDLISRAAALDKLDVTMRITAPDDYRLRIPEAIEKLPAVSAAPVVRCASCKWWNGGTLGTGHECTALHIYTTGRFYCMIGTRKSNAFADESGAEYADNPTV